MKENQSPASNSAFPYEAVKKGGQGRKKETKMGKRVLGEKTWCLLDTIQLSNKSYSSLYWKFLIGPMMSREYIPFFFFLPFFLNSLHRWTSKCFGGGSLSFSLHSLSLLHGSMGVFRNSTNTRTRNSRHHSLL